MRLSPAQIVNFCRCPRLFRKLSGKKPKSIFSRLSANKRGTILWEAMKRAHKYTAYEDKVYPWKYLRGYVGRAVSAEHNVAEDSGLEKCKNEIEHTMDYVQHWYGRFYLSNPDAGLINMKAMHEVNGVYIKETLPLVLAGDKPQVVLLNTSGVKVWKSALEDDLEARIILWLASRFFDTKIETITMVRSFDDGITFGKFSVKDNNNSIQEYLEQVALAIRAGFSYPNRTESCKLCRYDKTCRL